MSDLNFRVNGVTAPDRVLKIVPAHRVGALELDPKHPEAAILFSFLPIQHLLPLKLRAAGADHELGHHLHDR